MKKVTQKKNITKYLIMCIAFAVILFCGIFITIKGFNNYKVKELSYTQNCDIDYNVYLKPNSYFDSEVLGKDRTYITVLIDYIKAFYNYKVTFSEAVSGDYSYYITATMEAEKETKTYWTKEYTLLEEQTGTFDDYKTLELSQDLQINYNEYNDLMNEFKNEFSLSTDGNLKVVLHLKANIENERIKTTEISSDIDLNIPLSKQAIEAEINTSNIEGTKKLEIKEKIEDKSYLIYKVIGIFLIVSSIVAIIITIRKIKKVLNSNDAYQKSVKSILNGYDSIIVKTNHILDFSNLNIIKVSNFDDLIGVHNELRMPINFFEDKKNEQSLFILINNDMAWIYILQSSKLDTKIKL